MFRLKIIIFSIRYNQRPLQLKKQIVVWKVLRAHAKRDESSLRYTCLGIAVKKPTGNNSSNKGATKSQMGKKSKIE